MLSTTAARLLKGKANIEKVCRFCRYENYGGRKMVICYDNPSHGQIEYFGPNRHGHGAVKLKFVPKPETSLSAQTFGLAIHPSFGSGDKEKKAKRIGKGNDYAKNGMVGWNLANPEFKEQYRWAFNPHRQGGAYQSKKISE